MRKTDSLCAKNVSFNDIAQSHKGELISRGQLIMYYSVLPVSETCKKNEDPHPVKQTNPPDD